MKILYVFDFFSPQGGGTVNLLHSLSRALVQRGHEVSIYTTDLKLDEDYIASAPGVKIYPFHCISSLGRFYLTPSLMRTARENLRHFDIIHLQCFRSFQNIVIYYYARKYGVPYVIEHHGSLPRKVPGETNLKWLLRWLFDVIIGYRILNGAARIVLVNEFGVREYEAFGATNREIAVIPHYFNVEDFNNIPQRGQFRERFNLNGKKILLFLGRIHRIKGLDFLVASLHELSRLRPDVVLVIAGQDDGYQAALEELIRALNLSGQVVFTGFLSGQDKLAALVDADLLVLTSRYEYLAMVLIEALLCGTPVVVSSDTGAAEDIKRMNAGYLVAFGDRKRLIETIRSILADPSEAREKARQARDYIRANLSLDRIVEAYEKLYQDCLQKNTPIVSLTGESS